jgi:hypothetical protein
VLDPNLDAQINLLRQIQSVFFILSSLSCHAYPHEKGEDRSPPRMALSRGREIRDHAVRALVANL